MVALVLVTAPTSEPLTVAEVKAHLRLDFGSQESAPGAPTVALVAPAAAGNVDNGAHRYLVTFTTAAGETEAGVPSASVTVTDKAVNGQILVSAIPIGGATVTGRKLYRTAAGGSAYLLRATIADNTTTTYIDNLADASLGAGAPAASSTDDPLLTALITSARVAAETMTNRALVTQTWDLVLDRFPGWEMHIPKAPLQSVSSISYVDSNGVTQTLAATDYQVDPKSEPGRITPAYGQVWPSARGQMNAVTMRFVAGYGAAADVPRGIKDWMLLRITTLWENPAAIVLDARGLVELPERFIDGLLDPYRCESFNWVGE